jgi:hypothetical protein
VDRKVRIAVAVEAGLLKRGVPDVSGRTDEVVADHVRLPCRGGFGVAHDEADVPVEGHVVHPLQQPGGPRLRVAGVVVSPDGVMAGRVVLVPEAATGVALQAPCIQRPLHGKVLRRAAEGRDVLVRAEGHRDVVEDRVLATAIEVDAVAAGAVLPVAEAEVPDDDVIRGNAEGAVPQANAIARCGLARDGDLVLGDPQIRSRDMDIAADREDDGAATGRSGGDAFGKRSGTAAVQVHDDVNVAGSGSRSGAASAPGIGTVTFGTGERGDLGGRSGGEEEKEEVLHGSVRKGAAGRPAELKRFAPAGLSAQA